MSLCEPHFSNTENGQFSLAEFDHIWLIENFKKTTKSALEDLRVQEILARYMPQDFSIMRTLLGRPFARSPQGFCPFFSLSHSAGIAVLALSQEPGIGVDIELMRERPFRHKIAQRFFSATRELKLEEFYCAWTAREALIKALGHSLFDDLTHIEHKGDFIGLRSLGLTHRIAHVLLAGQFIAAICQPLLNARSLRYFRATR